MGVWGTLVEVRGFWGWVLSRVGVVKGLRLLVCVLDDVLQAAQGFVDRGGVWEGVEQVRSEEHHIGSLLDARVMFAANAFAEVEVRALCERVFEDGHSLSKGDTVLLEIGCRFGWVVLEN
jgi:hypothetical protein